METEIVLRVIVRKPPEGVAFAMQIGRDQLLPPKTRTKTRMVFEASAKIARAQNGKLRLGGPAIQGSGDKRFLYINSGQRAGDAATCIDRRAKVMLTDFDERLLRTSRAIETEIDGIGADGGPCCARVPLIGGWRAG